MSCTLFLSNRFLKEVFVQDVVKGHHWDCLYNDWIGVEYGSGDLCVEIPALSPERMHDRRLYQTMLKTSMGLRAGHIWLSIWLKPSYRSVFYCLTIYLFYIAVLFF